MQASGKPPPSASPFSELSTPESRPPCCRILDFLPEARGLVLLLHRALEDIGVESALGGEFVVSEAMATHGRDALVASELAFVDGPDHRRLATDFRQILGFLPTCLPLLHVVELRETSADPSLLRALALRAVAGVQDHIDRRGAMPASALLERVASTLVVAPVGRQLGAEVQRRAPTLVSICDAEIPGAPLLLADGVATVDCHSQWIVRLPKPRGLWRTLPATEVDVIQVHLLRCCWRPRALLGLLRALAGGAHPIEHLCGVGAAVLAHVQVLGLRFDIRALRVVHCLQPAVPVEAPLLVLASVALGQVDVAGDGVVRHAHAFF
mmetsp:Transcript_94643/g.273653  ORF Transcript_94643/g.273653 Transcript_94643/m.273653 type:complete len:324 (+) Transcript_94643:26-997(+)